MGLEGRLSMIGVEPEDLNKAVNNLYQDSDFAMAIIYLSVYVEDESESVKKNPGTMSSILYVKALIKQLCDELATEVSQININGRVDIEIRFLEESACEIFVDRGQIEIE